MKKFLSCVKKKSSLSPNPSTPRSALPSGYEIIEKDLSKLHRAASRGDVRAIRQQLKKHDINGLDSENRTALHLACANGHTGAVTLLVGKNCKLNICDNEHRSPLIKALQCQQVQCASILLKHKVNPDIVDIIGNTALHYAVLIPSKSTVVQIFKRGACLDTKNSVGCTPLILAVAISDKEIVEFLINEGVNMDAEDHQGRTPLMIASSNGHIGLVKTLLQHDVNIYKKDKTGWNAEDHAIMNGYDDCSHLIIKYSSQQRWKRSPPFYNSNIVTSPSIFSSPDTVVENSFALGGLASDKKDLSDWESSSCLSKDMPCNQLPADHSNNGILTGVELEMKCLTQPSEEKDLARKNAALQEEINALKQDLDQVKTSSQEKENRYIEEIKLLTEKVDDLRQELKMKEESFTETVLQDNGKVDALKTEAEMLSSKLNDELAIMYVKNNRLSLQLSKTEAKSNDLQHELYKALLSFKEKTLLLDNKQRDLAQGDARIKYLERMLQDQKEELSNSAVKQDSMQERLAQSVSENLLLRQQLEEAENKFTNMYNKLRTDTERRIQTYEENNKDLIKKSNELLEKLYKVESEKLGTKSILMQLKQDLADALKTLSVRKASLKDIKLNSKVESDKKDKKLVDHHIATESRFEQKWKKCNDIQRENSGLCECG